VLGMLTGKVYGTVLDVFGGDREIFLAVLI
jgi:hypothetical protein